MQLSNLSQAKDITPTPKPHFVTPVAAFYSELEQAKLEGQQEALMAVNPAMNGVSGAVLEKMAEDSWAAKHLGALAQKGVVMLATFEDYEEIMEHARALTDLGLPVTVLTTYPALDVTKPKQPMFCGAIAPAKDNSSVYKGMKFTPETEERNGRNITVITVQPTDKGLENVSREDLLVAASDALALEVTKNGILKADLGDRGVWVRIVSEKEGIRGAVAFASMKSARGIYVNGEWGKGVSYEETLLVMAEKYNSMKVPQPSAERIKHDALQSDFTRSSLRLHTASIAGAGRAGHITDEAGLAAIAVRDGADSMFLNCREPGSDDATMIDPLTVDLGRFIDVLANEGALTEQNHTELTADLLPLRNYGTADRVTADELKYAREVKSGVAAKLLMKLVENKAITDHKAILIDGEKPADAKALLQLLGRRQIRESQQALKKLGLARGQDIGEIRNANEVLEWLKIVSAVSFDSSKLTEGEADTLFAAISNAKSMAIFKGNRALKDSVIMTVTNEKNALLAAKYGIKVQLAAVSTDNGVNTLPSGDIVAKSNAGIIVDNSEAADMAIKLGAPEVAARCKGYYDNGDLARIYTATDSNAKGIKAILRLVKETVANGGNPVRTPQGQFNAGANDGENVGAKMFFSDLAGAVEYCKNKENIDALAAARDKASTGDLEAVRTYGRLYAIAGAALLMAVTGGAIGKDANKALSNTALRNLLVEALIAGVSFEGMIEDYDKISESTLNARLLRQVIAKASVDNASAEIETHFHRPLLFTGEKLDKDWLALAAKAMLVMLKTDLGNYDLSESARHAAEINMQQIAEVFKAG